jgi:hypothetical protein
LIKALLCENNTATIGLLDKENIRYNAVKSVIVIIGLIFFTNTKLVKDFNLYCFLFPFDITAHTWFLIRIDYSVVNHAINRTTQIISA